MYGNTYGVITAKCAVGDVHTGKITILISYQTLLGTDLCLEEKFKSTF